MSKLEEAGRSELWRSLQMLSREEGVRRPNLTELLRGELDTLQRVWRINLQNDHKDVQKAVSASLYALIVQLSPRDARQPLNVEQREKQYRHAVSVSFNLIEHPELLDTKLQERREWLAMKKRGELQIMISTSQRDLNHAIDQIEKILTSGEYSLIQASTQNAIETQNIDAQEATLLPSGQHLNRRSRFSRKAKRNFLSMAGVVLLVLITIIFVGPHFFSPEATDTPALTIDLHGYNSAMSGPTSFTFPHGYSGAQEFLRRADANEPYGDIANGSIEKFFINGIEENASLIGGVVVGFSVEGRKDQEATITNVRPILQGNRQEPDTGAAFILPEMGGSPRQLIVTLDASRHVVREVTDDGQIGRDYFREVERIGVRKSQKEELTVDFLAIAGKFEFKVAVDYTYDGIDHTVVFGRDGRENGPAWRVTSALCPTSKLIPESFHPYLADKYFDSVRLGVVGPGGPGQFTMRTVDPKIWRQQCF